MKIICVDKCQKLHNSNNNENSLSTMIDKGESPIIYFKPDSSLLTGSKPFFIPDFSSEIYCEAKLVIKINRLGKNIAKRFAHRYYEEVTIGIDLTAVDIFEKLKSNGLPWELSKVFDNSAPIGNFILKDELNTVSSNILFEVTEEDTSSCIQEYEAKNIFSEIDSIICFMSKLVTLKIGDLIFISLPMNRKKVNINNHITGRIDNKTILNFHIY